MQSLFIFPLFACLISSVCLLVLVLPQFVAVCYLLVLFISLCCFVIVVVVLWCGALLLVWRQFDASFGMSSKGGECLAFCNIYGFSLCVMVLLVFLVTCKNNKGQLYLDKFDISKRHLGKYVLFCGAHYTLPEVLL